MIRGHADDLRALGDARESPAGARARLDERLEREAQAVPVARHRDGVDRRRDFGILRRHHAAARIEAERRHDFLAVLEFEETLNRLAVAGGRRHVGNPRRVRRAEVAEEHDARPRAAGQHGQHRVAFAHARGRDVLHFLLPLHPAVARDDDDVVFLDDEVVGGVLLLLHRTDNLGPPRVAVRSSARARSRRG